MISKLFMMATAVVAEMTAAATHLDESLIQTSGSPSVSAGKFYGYRTASEGPSDAAFSSAKALAEKEGVPLVVIWSHESCHYCDDFIVDLNRQKSEVAMWFSANRAVFAFFKATGYDGPHLPENATAGSDFTTPKACLDAWQFVTGVCRAQPVWPLIGFYYRQPDGKSVVWGHGYREKKDFAYLRDSFAAWCKENGINLPHGGQFTDVGTDFNRYEAEEATQFVDVTLVRNAVDAVYAGENRLEAVWPENRGETVETNVIWAVGQDRAVAHLPLRLKDTAEFPVGEKITLNLYDAMSGEQTGTNFVFCVSPENASGNPLWIGERSVETLGWGEWTVDLDVATQKVASAEGSAYTVVSLQGSKWCPDCANVERNFLDLTNEVGQNRFRLWAKERNVALVSIDIPNFNGPTPDNYASPSLLDRTAFSTTLARAKEYPQSGADGSLLTAQMRSGIGYLSRKMADDATARTYFERNWFLAAKNTSEGGFHRPEDGNKNRTGVPIFVLLRKDGSVAARLTRMASVSPMASDRENFDAYLKRFEEMMAIADAEEHGDATEIENNHWATTPLAVATDCGLVSNELCHADFQDVWRLDGAGVRTRQSVAVRGESAANVTVSILWVDAERTQRTLASLTGRLDEGLALTNDFTRAGDYFVQVAGANITNSEFRLENSVAGNFHRYQLETKSEQFPPETGEISFASPDVSVVEYAGTGVISVVRRNGSFGRTRVRVVCDNPPKDDRFEWNDTVLEWGEDEAGERQVFLPIVPNGSSDTNVTFVLRLEPDVPCVSEVSVGTCAVTVLDTDLPCLGQTSYVLQPNANFETAVPFDVYNVSNASTLAISVKKGSGTVPKGLRFVVDKTTGSVTLVGVPSEPGTYSFTVVLTEKRKNKTVTGLETVLTLTVADRSPENPRLAEARPRVTLPLYADGIVAGTLSFAVTSRGQISARYTGTESRAISFAGNWQAFDEETGSAFAVLQTDGAVLSVAMDTDGFADLSLDLPPEDSYFAGESGLTLVAASDWPTEASFAAWQGRYNVTFPCAGLAGRTVPVSEPSGTGFLQLDLSSGSSAEAGLVRYAGRLSDGTAVSGSARLIRDASSPSAALLPVFRKVSRSCFSATLEIGADGAKKWDKGGYEAKAGFLDREIVNAAPDTVALTLHRDDAWDYVTTNEVYGSYFIPGVDPAELSRLFYDGRWQFALQFKASQTPPSERHGEVRLVDANANVAINTNAVWMISENDHVVFSYDPQTGIFSGGADLVFADGRTAFGEYCGALIPGWTTCGCGLENPPIRPFGSGTLRYRDWVNGRAVIRSFPVDLDALPSADGSEPPSSPAVKVGAVAVGDDAGLSPSAPLEVIADADLTMLADRRIGDELTADDVAVIGQYDAVTKCGVTAVSGLPTGLKLVKMTEGSITTYSVVGSFTAAKDFTVRVTVAAEDPGTGKIVKTTSSQKVSVGDVDKIALTATVVDAESAPGCKVSGSGSYKRTAKATFKATAAKGFVFAGWYGADGMPLALDGADYRSPSVSEIVNELTVRDRYASFVPTADDGLVLDGLDGEVFGFDPCDGKTFRAVFDVQSLSLPTLTFKGLPTGVTCAPSGDFPSEYALIYDPATVRTAPKPGRYPVTATAKNATLETAAAAVTADFLITVSNLVSETIAVADDYGVLTPDIEMTPISLSDAVDFAAGWTLSVSGLPTGLKYNAKDYERMISGTPTKPGEYTLTFTAKKGRTTETATAFITVKPRPEITAEVIDAAAHAAGCKVTGTGNFKRDTKVTLKAVEAKGWVFAGWGGDLTDELEGIDRLSPTLACSLQQDTNSVSATFIPIAGGGLSFDWEGDVELAVGQDIAEAGFGGLVRDNLNAKSWPTVTVSGLPAGIRFDTKTLRLSGAATKSGVSFVNVSAKDAAGYAFSATVRFVIGGAKIDEPDEIGSAWGVDFSAFDGLRLGEPFEWRVESWMEISASGLPTGLALVQKGVHSGEEPFDVICGTPTKAGKFTLKFTMKDPISGKTLKTQKTIIVRGAPSGYVGAESAPGGTVTGVGVYGAGATVRLVAKPDRNFVFAGWYETDGRRCAIDGFDYRTPTLSYLASGLRTFVPKFISKTEDLADDFGLWGHDACSDATDWRVEDRSEYFLWADSLSLPKLTVKGLPTGMELKGLYLDGEDPFPVYIIRVKDKSKLKPGRYPVTVTAENVSKVKRTWMFTALVPNLTSDVIQGLDTSDEGYQLWLGVGSYATPEMAALTGRGYDFRSPSAGVTANGDRDSIKVDGLPMGLKFGRDPAASLCCGMISTKEVYGIPTKLGTSLVTVTLTSGGQIEKATAFATVNARPAWAVGTFGGYQVSGIDAGEFVTLTAAADGKVSGKIGMRSFTATIDRYFVDYWGSGRCGFAGVFDNEHRYIVLEEDPDMPGVGRALIYTLEPQWEEYWSWWRDEYAGYSSTCLAWQNPWAISDFSLTGVSGNAGTLSNGLKVQLDGNGSAIVAGGVNGTPFSASFPVRLVGFSDYGEGLAAWDFEVAVSIPSLSYMRLVGVSASRDSEGALSIAISKED